MKEENASQRLNLITTPWSLVCQANHGASGEARAARQHLLERYGSAVRRYLRKVLHNADADELFQEFPLRVVHGDLRGANPERGQFRNFVKGTLFHLIARYHKQKRQWPGPLPDDGAELAANPDDLESDRQFL